MEFFLLLISHKCTYDCWYLQRLLLPKGKTLRCEHLNNYDDNCIKLGYFKLINNSFWKIRSSSKKFVYGCVKIGDFRRVTSQLEVHIRSKHSKNVPQLNSEAWLPGIYGFLDEAYLSHTPQMKCMLHSRSLQGMFTSLLHFLFNEKGEAIRIFKNTKVSCI